MKVLCVVGKLDQAPQYQAPKGKAPYAQLRLCVAPSDPQDRELRIDVVCFKALAEEARTLEVGATVYAWGELRLRAYAGREKPSVERFELRATELRRLP